MTRRVVKIIIIVLGAETKRGRENDTLKRHQGHSVKRQLSAHPFFLLPRDFSFLNSFLIVEVGILLLGAVGINGYSSDESLMLVFPSSFNWFS